MIDLDSIRRTLANGELVFPTIILSLVERCEAAEQRTAALSAALLRYANGDSCEYGDGPPCPGDVAVSECRYCQAMRAFPAVEGMGG